MNSERVKNKYCLFLKSFPVKVVQLNLVKYNKYVSSPCYMLNIVFNLVATKRLFQGTSPLFPTQSFPVHGHKNTFFYFLKGLISIIDNVS